MQGAVCTVRTIVARVTQQHPGDTAGTATAKTRPTATATSAACASGSSRSNQTLKGQLSLEDHGGRIPAGMLTRVAQRLLAMTAGIWHN